jgi:hypothetical protein
LTGDQKGAGTTKTPKHEEQHEEEIDFFFVRVFAYLRDFVVAFVLVEGLIAC